MMSFRSDSRLRAFLSELRQHQPALSRQQRATLRGLAVSGDLEAAQKGLATLARKQRTMIQPGYKSDPKQADVFARRVRANDARKN